MACADDLIPVRIKTEVMEESSENTRNSSMQHPTRTMQDMTDSGLDTDVQSAHYGKPKTSTCSVSIRDEIRYNQRSQMPFSKNVIKIVRRASLGSSDAGLVRAVSNNSPNFEIRDRTHLGSAPSAMESEVKTIEPNFILDVGIKKEVEDSGYDPIGSSSKHVCANSEAENSMKMVTSDVGYDTVGRANRSMDTCTLGGDLDNSTRTLCCAGDTDIDQAWSERSLPFAPVKSEVIDMDLHQSQLDVHVYETCVDAKCSGKYESTDEDADLASDLGVSESAINDHTVSFTHSSLDFIGRRGDRRGEATEVCLQAGRSAERVSSSAATDRTVLTPKRQGGAKRQKHRGAIGARSESYEERCCSASETSDSEDSSLQQGLATLAPPQKKHKRCYQKSKLTYENPSHCIVCSRSSLSEKDVAAFTRGKKARGLKNAKPLMDTRDKTVGLENKDIFQCKNCGMSFNFAADLLSHLTFHEEARQRALSESAKRKRGKGKTKSQKVLTRKPRSERLEETLSTSIEARSCPVCGSVFSSVHTLQLHMKNPNQPLLDSIQHPGVSESGNVTSDSERKNQHRVDSSGSGYSNVNPKKICHSKPACPDGNEGGNESFVLDCPSEESQLLPGTASPQITQPTDERLLPCDKETRDNVIGVKRQSAKGTPAPHLRLGSLLETPPLTCGCTAVPRQGNATSSPPFMPASTLATSRESKEQASHQPLRSRKRFENLSSRRGQQAIPDAKAILVKSQNWDIWSGDKLPLKTETHVRMANDASALTMPLTETKIPDRRWTNPHNDLSLSANLHSDSPPPPKRYNDLSSPPDIDTDLPPDLPGKVSNLSPPPDPNTYLPPLSCSSNPLPPHPTRDSKVPPPVCNIADPPPPPTRDSKVPPPVCNIADPPPHPTRDSKVPPPVCNIADPPPPPNPHSDLAARRAKSRAVEVASAPGPRPVEKPFLCKYCCQHFATAEQHDEHQAAQHTGQLHARPPAAQSDHPTETQATGPQLSQTVRCSTSTATRDAHFAWPFDDCSVPLTSTSDANAARNSGVTSRDANTLLEATRSRKRLASTSLTAQRDHLKRGCLPTRLTAYSLTTLEDNRNDEPDPKGTRAAGSFTSLEDNCNDESDPKGTRAAGSFTSPSSSTRATFSCRYCEGAFSTPQGLSAHQRVHIKNRPYDCNECTQRFISSHELELHKRSQHVGCVPFLCSLCNATFPTSKGANIHLAKHERERAMTESVFNARCTRSHKSGVVPAKVCVPLASPVVLFSPKTSCPLDASVSNRRQTDHPDHRPAKRDTYHPDGTLVSRESGHPDHRSAWRETYRPDHTPASLESSATSMMKYSPSGPSGAQKTPFTNIQAGLRTSSGVKTLAWTEQNAPNTRQRMKNSVVTGTREEEPGTRPLIADPSKTGVQCDPGVVFAVKDETREFQDSLVLMERDQQKRCNLKRSHRGHSGSKDKQRRKPRDTQLSDDRALVKALGTTGSRPWVEMVPSQGYVQPAHIATVYSGPKPSRGLRLQFIETQRTWSELSTPLLNKGQIKEQSPGRAPCRKQYSGVHFCGDAASQGLFLAHTEHTRCKRSHSEDSKRLKSIDSDKRMKNRGKNDRFDSPIMLPQDKADDNGVCPRWPDSNTTTACTPSADERKATDHKCHICKKKFPNAKRLWQHRLTHFSELKQSS